MRTKLSEFNFNLPDNLIAKKPAPYRDESRLMVVHKDTGKIELKIFKDVIDYFNEDDVLLMNNTKVFPARLIGQKEKTESKIEVFLLRELNSEVKLWDVLVDPARKIRVGNKLYFGEVNGPNSLTAEVVDNTTSRGRTIRFIFEGEEKEFKRRLAVLGVMPIPKYLKRESTPEDIIRYQTVYAKVPGAVAAPTAGLHFSKNLMKRLEIKGITFAELTLHIGLGTFNPIQVEDLSKHKMDAEYFKITPETAQVVNDAIKNKSKIISVGTTSVRSVESAVSAKGILKHSEGWTNSFIFPPYDFSIPDALVTNFHLPKSSLFIMVSAFGGKELMREAYELAIKEKFRFYSYGDAMLII